MALHVILASGSAVRADLLRRARLEFDVIVPRIDEDAVKNAMLAEKATPRDVADVLAEMKARKIADQNREALVIGCDQVLDLDGDILDKPQSKEEGIEQLARLSGRRHILLSAAVIYAEGEPVWRHVGKATLAMHRLSEPFMRQYVDRNWDSIRHSVGGYKLEEEGVRLFTSIQGDFFHVLGMPLLEILAYLTLRGDLDI